MHDDNVFSSAFTPQADWVLRVSPELRAGYRSPATTVRGQYGFDAERYDRHPVLGSSQARRRALLEARLLPRRNWELSLGGAFTTTNNAGELNTASGIELGRVEARRLALHPAVSSRLDASTSVTAAYSFVRDELVAGPMVQTNIAGVMAEERLGTLSTAEAAYRVRRFGFTADSATTAHVPTLAWTRRTGRRTRFRVEAGPRFYLGTVGAEVAARVAHRRQRVEASLDYVKSQATLLGQVGVMDVDAVTATIGYSPVRALHLSAAPALFWSEGINGRARVRRLELGAAFRVARRLSLLAAHMVNVQDSSLAGTPSGHISRRVSTVRLVAGEI